MNISDIVKLRGEVIRGDISGWIRLRGLFEGGREANADYIFSITYPTVEIKNMLDALGQKLRGERAQGFFEILGGYGTGKSHILVLMYHLFKSPDKARRWLNNAGVSLDIPNNVSVLAISLTDYPPRHLWEPIFRGLGREDLLERVVRFPGTSLLKEVLRDKPLTVIIIDELESWYSGIKDEAERKNNLNFLQVLAEVACEEGLNLLVFCALYGEVSEIMGRTERIGPYRVNLTLSRDRPKIALFRLVSDIVDREALRKIAREYIECYSEAELEIPDLPSYEKSIIEYYPIHPELMNVLLTRYSSSRNYQNTRGILYLLSSILRKRHDVDLLLTSDIDVDEDELLTLGRELVENAKKDADTLKDNLSKKILNAVLLYSFGEGAVGASREDMVLGVLRPGININDVDLAISELPSKAPHIWVRDGKYVIGYQENVITLIQNRAIERVRKGEVKKALSIIMGELKRDKSHYVYHPDPEFSEKIEDEDNVKIVVSLKTLNQEELMKLYKGREFANRLIVFTPKSGDLTKDEDLLVVAERLNLCNEFKESVSGENKVLLSQQESKDFKHLRDKLSEAYGYWVKITEFKPEAISYRLISSSLERIMGVVKSNYDVGTIEGAILDHLEGKEDGLKLGDIAYDFKTTPGKPIVLDDEVLREAVKRLWRSKQVEVEYKGKCWDGVSPLKDDARVVLKKYYKPPIEIFEPSGEESPKPKGEIEEAPPGEREKLGKAEKGTLEPPITTVEFECGKPFGLSYEIDRRVPDGAVISCTSLTYRRLAFSDLKSFLEFIRHLDVKDASFPEIEITMKINRSLNKKELEGIVDNLPTPKEGTIKAKLEVKNR